MTNIKLKRAYDPADEKQDGLRVLVDRIWPRGLSREELHCDVWERQLAPSTELRKWFHEDPTNRWDEFIQKYKDELSQVSKVYRFINKIKYYSIVTLIYGAKDSKHSHAQVLLDTLTEKLKEENSKKQ